MKQFPIFPVIDALQLPVDRFTARDGGLQTIKLIYLLYKICQRREQ